MIWKNRYLFATGQSFKCYLRGLRFVVFIGGSAVFVSLWVFIIPLYCLHLLKDTLYTTSERVNHSSFEAKFQNFHDVGKEEKSLDYTRTLRTPKNKSDIPATILAAGDIAKCDGEDHWGEKFLMLVGRLPDYGPKESFLENLLELLFIYEENDYPTNALKTARLILGLPGRVLALGDLAYPTGSTQQFQECYESTWGQFKVRTHPVPGNHEYKQKDAEPYFTYWGHRAGEPGRGYYSFDVGEWHIIALNSKIEKDNHRHSTSAQHEWLQNDLAKTKARCILAYWHHPVFSSGQQSGTTRMKNILHTLYNIGVTIVLTGHAHHYERFAPQNPEGVRDPVRGFRQFVVGTGGAPLRPLKNRHKNSEVFKALSYGVLRLDLYSYYYTWQFLPGDDVRPHDTGIGTCVISSRTKALLQQT